jgi:competence protein ComEC
MLQKKPTTFRAYQLGSAGSSFSYFDGMFFTLLEARFNDINKPQIIREMNFCRKQKIDTLHITSWDQDHCSSSELEIILSELRPTRIEYPGYEPHTDCGKESLEIIQTYIEENQKKSLTCEGFSITPEYINKLESASTLGYKNIFYSPKSIAEKSNDNSTVKFFRVGCFNVLSLGDVESSEISSRLLNCLILKSEVDVLILAHHGADNGFTSNRFLKQIKPKIAICSSNYDNQYEHPKQEIRDMLRKNDIFLYTTKTGDVLIRSREEHCGASCRAYNFISGSEELSSRFDFSSKKSTKLSNNNDTIRDMYRKKSKFH